jgi:RNA polymerase sigma-70 factor (ECF subfamily)
MDAAGGLAEALASERDDLVRLCARLSRTPEAAEDLAQETLLQAWQHADRLRDPDAYRPWLHAIARNVCLAWARAQYRAAAHRAPAPRSASSQNESGIESLPDSSDLQVEVERTELAGQLTRAIALLPPATRRVLIAQYRGELGPTEIARRLGLSPGVVMVRLHRGRRALRRALATELREEALAYGLVERLANGWVETDIWCVGCGQRRLVASFDPLAPRLVVRCPDCTTRLGAIFAESVWPDALQGAASYKAALSRLQRLSAAHYRRALAGDRPLCTTCGGPAELRIGMPDSLPPAIRRLAGAHILCPACGAINNLSLAGLSLTLPEVRRFWRQYPRMRALPEAPLAEAEGRAALVARFESMRDGARLELVVAADDFHLLGIHPSSKHEHRTGEACA